MYIYIHTYTSYILSLSLSLSLSLYIYIYIYLRSAWSTAPPHRGAASNSSDGIGTNVSVV